LIVKHSGQWHTEQVLAPKEKMSCTFERIYFSKGNDKDIYRERRELGRLLAPMILKRLDYDVENSVFSYIPNTASTCFYGLIDGVNEWLDEFKIKQILENKDNLTTESLTNIFKNHARREKILLKDAKLRTFITNDNDRVGIVGSAYDITYGSIQPTDTLVIVDDSIVRGTTLKNSILSILKRLNPKKIIIVSSAPQIRYPDCYGIDMSRMNDFVAFRAVLEILKDKGMTGELNRIYQNCVEENKKPIEQIENKVKELYELMSEEEITSKIATITKPKEFKPELEIIFQSIENLHNACPNHHGDWYFSGNYPTPGGNKVVNKAFIYFMEGITQRAY
jgi:amidophosphoribosyltransferase